jgi:hypothetical protein
VVAAAHIHGKLHGEGRIGFIAEEVVIGAVRADEFFRPVTLLARFGPGAGCNGRGDRAEIY